MRGTAGRLGVLAALSLGTSAIGPATADARALAAVPLPPGAFSRVVATDLSQDGRLTSVATLEPAADVETTLAFYREAWPSAPGARGHLEARAGDWRVLSRVEGRTLLVVQLRDGADGTEGFVSAASLEPGAALRAEPPPMPAGGELLSSTRASDGAHEATTSILVASARPGEIAAFYRDRLARDGWALVSDREHGGARVLLLDGREARVEIVVSDVDGRSVVVFNEVRRDG